MAGLLSKSYWMRPIFRPLVWYLTEPVCQQSRRIASAEIAAVFGLYDDVPAQQISPEFGTFRLISSNKVEVNDVKLHYEETGAGHNVVLLMPGALGCSQTDFKHQLETMNKDMFKIIAWDPRGYGMSIPPERDWPEKFLHRDAEDAANLMEELAIAQYSVLGWSDGGIAALIMAARYPDRIQKLAVWGANAYVTDGEIAMYEKIRNVDTWSEAMQESFLQVYDIGYLRKHFSLWVDAITRYKTKYGGDICQSDLEKIQCPTLVLHGEKDPLLPRFHPEFLTEKIKNARLELFPEGKHNIHQRYYKEFNSIIRHFLVTGN